MKTSFIRNVAAAGFFCAFYVSSATAQEAGSGVKGTFLGAFNFSWHCGEGRITAVIVGGYDARSLHLEVDWADGRAPSTTSVHGGRNVRYFEPDMSAVQFKNITAAAYLAFANNYLVRFGSSRKTDSNVADCARATELQLTQAP